MSDSQSVFHLPPVFPSMTNGSSEVPLSIPRSYDPTWRRPPEMESRQQILIVDDEELNIRVVRKYLHTWGFEFVNSTTEPTEAVQRIRLDRPDLILLDVMMPEVSGLEILRELRSDPLTRHLPVIILTAHTEDEVKQQALELGANDFLGKPIVPAELLPRVRNLLALRAHQSWLERTSEYLEEEVLRRTAALVRAEKNIVNCLARAAEYRDNETGRHIVRVGRYAALIARAIGMSPDYIALIEDAAKLHDVGKIGIPDSILLKTETLDPDEYKTIKGHCEAGGMILREIREEDEEFSSFRRHVKIGAKILGAADSPLLAMASRIAMTHHEWWDGTGYPFGLAGEQIPLEGRITAVADVFDALSTRRPYKQAYPLEHCYQILRDWSGTHFEPRLVDVFLQHKDEAVAIQMSCSDPS
jgi:putative two-component system response regulator